MRREIVIFLILYLLWIVLSGMFDVFHLSLGFISCFIVTFMSRDLIFRSEKISKNHLKHAIRFILYVPWLLYQILLSNIHVAYLVLHPKTIIDPALVSYKSKLKDDISKVVFANSITLTPGTITIDIVNDTFIIHCISKKVADDLFSGEMENRIAFIFEDEKVRRS